MKIALVAYDFEDYCIRLAGGLANLVALDILDHEPDVRR